MLPSKLPQENSTYLNDMTNDANDIVLFYFNLHSTVEIHDCILIYKQ